MKPQQVHKSDDGDEFRVTAEMVQELMNKVDAGKYPETTSALLDWLCAEEDGNEEDPMDLGKALHDADRALPMQKDVADFLILLYQSEIACGNADAMLNLGALYYEGRCGIQNFAKAQGYYEMADAAGNRIASENLGYIWYYGRTGKVNDEKAFQYFVKAAFAGRLRALYKVGDCYRYGRYVEKDEQEAFQIYSMAEGEMNGDSIQEVGADIFMRLADCCMDGIGTEQELSLAQMYYSQAEILFYDRLHHGDFYQKENLRHVLDEQEKIRTIRLANLPDLAWSDGLNPAPGKRG